MSDYRELLIGCGSRRDKDILRYVRLDNVKQLSGDVELCKRMGLLIRHWQNLTTLDNNPKHNPDIVCDLEYIPLKGYHPMSESISNIVISSDAFDEIHAYEVLEHIARQGDYIQFFRQFTEFHRILKPNGLFCATCPSWASPWAWGDPSHTRVITSGTLVFLSQAEYTKQVGVTAMSDFRHVYTADFEPVFVFENHETLAFVLRAIK